MSTQVEQAQEENSLHDDLSQAFDEVNSNEPEVNEDVTEEQEQIEEIEALMPPEYFKKEHKTTFEKLAEMEGGRDFQQTWLDQYNEGQEFINGKLKEVDGWNKEREQYQRYQQAITPMAEQWKQQFGDPNLGLSQMVSYAQALQADPQGTLFKLAEQYGVNLEEAFQEQPYVDPTVRTLQNKLSQQEQAQQAMQMQWQQNQQQQQIAQVNSQISNFKEAKNETGELVNPHFDAVQEQMGILIKAGQAKSIDEAYEMSVANNVEIQREIWKAEKVKELASKQTDIKKAKQASQRTNSKTKDEPEKELSLREQLEANYDG